MSIFDTLFGKLKSVLRVVADRVEGRIEDVKEKIEQHFDIPTDVVERRLDEKAANDPRKLRWRVSIVDLLEVLDMDSSITARKALAKEFDPDHGREFSGKPEQNIWLHKQVMAEIAHRGIPIPQPD